MDETQLRKTFSMLVFNDNSGKREQALEQLSAEENRHASCLVQIGSVISKVVHESASADSLEQALDAANSLQMTSFWRSFAETSAHAILIHAQKTQQPDKSKLLDYGFQMMFKALNGGMFPLSEASFELLDEITAEHKSYAEQAESMKATSKRHTKSIKDPNSKKGKPKIKKVQRKRPLGRRR